jgi:hypothetical protein
MKLPLMFTERRFYPIKLVICLALALNGSAATARVPAAIGRIAENLFSSRAFLRLGAKAEI